MILFPLVFVTESNIFHMRAAPPLPAPPASRKIFPDQSARITAKGRFGKQDFVYIAQDDVYRCPAG